MTPTLKITDIPGDPLQTSLVYLFRGLDPCAKWLVLHILRTATSRSFSLLSFAAVAEASYSSYVIWDLKQARNS